MTMKSDRFFGRSLAQAHERGPQPIYAPRSVHLPQRSSHDVAVPTQFPCEVEPLIQKLLDDLEWLAPALKRAGVL